MKINPSKQQMLAKFAHTINKDDNVANIERIAGLYPRGYISIVASMAGTGKTWLMQYIACQLSTGGRILNGLTESGAMKCLIFSGETGAELLTLRQKKTCWKANPCNITVYSAIELATAGMSCWLNTPDGQDTIFQIVQATTPDIIWFDTLISFHTADESKQGEMTTIYVWLARLAKAFKCAVVCNHHTRKRPASDSKRKFTQEDVIGSSAGVRLAASVYVISSKDKEGGGFVNTVDNVKAWDKKVPPFSYEFTTTSEGIDFIIDLNIRPDLSVPQKFATWLASFEYGNIITVSDVMNACQCSRYFAEQSIDKAVTNGVLVPHETIIRGRTEIFYSLNCWANDIESWLNR